MVQQFFRVRKGLTVANSSASANLDPLTLTISSFTANSTLVNAQALNVVNQINTATFFAETSANVGTAVVNSVCVYHPAAVNVGANVYLSTAQLFIGNNTVNAIANSLVLQLANSTTAANLTSSTLYIGANVYVNTTTLSIGNSQSNTIANSSVLRTGQLTITGAISANGSVGASNQVLFSNASVAYWSNAEITGECWGINTQTTTYTLALSDKGKTVEVNTSGANNLTVPNNASVAFPVNTYINIVQYGAGQLTIVAGTGVTIRSHLGLKLGGQYAMATLYKRGTNEWVAGGDLMS